MTTVLLTGFEPFAGAPRNPSWDAVARIAASKSGTESGDVELQSVLLPVAFDRSGALLREAVERVRPDVVIAVGLAEGRFAITPERVAVNLDDARVPDADGARPVDEPAVPRAPAAYFTTLPVKRMVEAARAAGAPAALSSTAGAYVCNHVFVVLQDLAAERPGLRSGFVHVPATPETVPGRSDVPVVDLDVIVRGLVAMIDAAIDLAPDAVVPGGTIS